MTTQPKTLLELAGRKPAPPKLSESILVLIDIQNEYLDGPIALPGASAAVAKAADLLARARKAGAKIVHVAHKGGKGSLFDREGHRGAIVDAVAPVAGEAVVEKPRPNAFSGTDLADLVGAPSAPLVIVGFMTHMCVSSTARAALDLGYQTAIAADACATRDLPTPAGDVIDAARLHEAELAALADRFAGVFRADEIV
ncbi:MAG: cysteine hydrolase family protein [Phreatobacter sp.]|uniref:cysteine hydrolase family protein n=1 Tax=Phreatobacter sp. TaxID=1966341 RepID=UPI00403736C9